MERVKKRKKGIYTEGSLYFLELEFAGFKQIKKDFRCNDMSDTISLTSFFILQNPINLILKHLKSY
jgi:hypothetical protein